MKPIKAFSKSFGLVGYVEMVGDDGRILVKFDDVNHWLPPDDLTVLLETEEWVPYIIQKNARNIRDKKIQRSISRGQAGKARRRRRRR